MKRVVTMKDLALELGLSISTIARSLSDSPRIGRETKARVMDTAERVGYVVDFAARSMRSGKSSLVGLIVPDLRNEFYSTAAKAISDQCHEGGLQFVLSITDDDPESELQHLRNMHSARVMGVVIIPTVVPLRDTVKLLKQIPHVQFVRKSAKFESDWFGIDDVAAMQLATNHLIGLGHKHIGYIGSTTLLSTGQERLAGFRRTLADAGIDPSMAVVETGSCDTEFGYAAMERILARPQRPTGLVTAGARICAGAYDCARTAGVNIPGDMSFVGFSDSPAYRWWGTGLTTIGLPVEEMAIASTSFLLRRAERMEKEPDNLQNVFFKPSLVQRGSTATPPQR